MGGGDGVDGHRPSEGSSRLQQFNVGQQRDPGPGACWTGGALLSLGDFWIVARLVATLLMLSWLPCLGQVLSGSAL